MRLYVLAVLLTLLANGRAGSREIAISKDGKIVGGVETTIAAFPYQVALSYLQSFRCGGSILNENIILTAAHCLYDVKLAQQLAVRAGSSDRGAGGQVVAALRTMIEPRFTMSELNFDVGLVRLQTPLTLTNVVRPIQLVGPGAEPAPGSSITLSGWGVTREGAGRVPITLRTAKVSVVRRWRCTLAYALSAQITDAMFCASARGKDACQGDSGGPAVNREGKQAGIVSFGQGCANFRYPGVYTNLANPELHRFIEETMRVL